MSAAPTVAEIVQDAEGNAFSLAPIDCPTCGLDDTQLVGLRGGEHHRYRLGITTSISRCRRCGLLYPNPFPTPLNPQKLYGDPDKYFGNHDSAAKVQGNRQLIRAARARLTRPMTRVLDVGSGRGELLEAARLEGVAESVGLELSEAMIDYAREHYRAEVLPKTIEGLANDAPSPFDVVFLNAVLEHVYDPNAMIDAAKRLTKPGSLLYIDIPNEPHLLTRIGNLANRLRGTRTVLNLSPTFRPYHVFGFNPRALRTLLNKHGFVIRDLRLHATPRIPARGGIRDRIQANVGVQIMRLANLTRTASNMFVWAERHT